MQIFGSMFVWIPRYSYKITKGEHTATAGAIAIKWSNNTQDDTSGYIPHPAFKLGNDDLKGIWIAKFEPSHSNATNTAQGSGTTLKIVPSVQSWRSINISTAFTTCRSMEKTNLYGWTAQAGALNTDGSITGDSNNFDVHMMKNVEWGAVAYLTHSIGKTGKVWKNPNTSVLTGHAGATEAEGYTASTTDYKSAKGVHASTTDTVYGIYDMNGGANEYIMAVTDSLIYSSGFSTLPNIKYYDLYTGSTVSQQTNYDLNTSKKGDAIYETSSAGSGNTSWYGDESNFVKAYNSWFTRGGTYVSSATGIFSFSCNSGESLGSFTFRPVIGI
jgi:hypothetical protein